MAKMVNPKTVNDMTIVNLRAQSKMNQLVQKVGKGKRRVKVNLSKSTGNYLTKMLGEMRKQMAVYEKQVPNVFKFFDYLEKEVKITNKKEKSKEVLLSYEELDFLKIQIKETIKGINNIQGSLKWYNLIKKGLYKTMNKQNELILEELSKTSVNK